MALRFLSPLTGDEVENLIGQLICSASGWAAVYPARDILISERTLNASPAMLVYINAQMYLYINF